jgi:hypothetical protein
VAVVIVAIVAGIMVLMGAVTAFFLMQVSPGPERSTSSGPSIAVVTNQPVPGILTTSEPRRTYEFQVTQNGLVTVSVVGDFDSYLELYSGDESSPRWEDDDSGGGLNARIMTTLAPGRYRALVRPYSQGSTGSYTFTVTAPMEPTPMTLPPGTAPGLGTPPLAPPTPPVPGVIAPETRNGTVAAVAGNAPVATGSQCIVQIQSASTTGGLNCRIIVTCGGTVIYGREDARGQYGFNRCSVAPAGSGPGGIEAHDTNVTGADGDPRIDLQTAFGEIVVSDLDPSGAPWTVSIRFTPPAGAPPPGGAPTTAI